MMRFLFTIALLLMAAPATAQTGDPMAAYRDYRASLEAGDYKAALDHAETAFEMAEAQWGDNDKRTALLATNYGVELLNSGSPKDAAPILERCARILEPFPDAANDRAFCFLKAGDAYTAAEESRDAGKAYDRAIDIAEPLADGDKRAAGTAGEAYLALAKAAIPSLGELRAAWANEVTDTRFKNQKSSLNRYTPTRRYAQSALPFLESAYGPQSELVGLAVLYVGFYYEAAEEWNDAEKYYTRAHEIFVAARGKNDRITLQAYARRSIAYQNTPSGRREFKDAVRTGDNGAGCIEAQRGERTFSICADGKRDLPRYPTTGGASGQQGFVLMRYDVDEQGRTSNVRVVESWPGGDFDTRTISAVEKWRYEPPVDQNGKVGAVQDVETSVTFFIGQ